MSLAPQSPSTAAWLQLISCRGVPAPAVLQLEEGQALSLQAIADQSPVAVPADTLAALQQCRVEPAAGSSGTQWWLRNLDCTLRCAVNASSLGVGEALPLRDGDLIELGLVQIGFQVGAYAPAATTAPAAPMALSGAAGAPGAPDTALFRLTDLVQLAAPASWHPTSPAQADTPFAGIADAFDGQAAKPPQPHIGAPLPATTPAGADDTHESTAHPPGVMEALHRQYLRLMQNPNDPQMAGRWATPELGVHALAPSFDELRQQAVSRDLYDILGHSAAIDPILERLDTLSEHDILRLPAPVDVLRLFAPTERSSTEAGLPGLTRRDHHGVTADSAMRLQAGADGPTANATSVPDPAPTPTPRTEPRP